MRTSRSEVRRATPAAALATFALLLSACAGPKTAPPPPMGDLSGPWLLEADGKPLRFVSAEGETLSVTLSQEPVVVRQGAAVSDTSIALDIAGIHVAGAMEVTKGVNRDTDAELVTAGPSSGRLTFFAPVLTFSGKWTDGVFSGRYRVDPEQAGKDVVVLDAPRAWRLRRMGPGKP